jgi:hypothetical protein
MFPQFISHNQQDENRHTDITRYEPSRVKRFGDEQVYAVKDDQECASDEPVACFEPLAVGLVGVAWVVAVVGCGLGFGGVAVEFEIVEGAEEAEIRGADSEVDDKE